MKSSAEKAAEQLFVVTKNKDLAEAFAKFRTTFINTIVYSASLGNDRQREVFRKQIEKITNIK